MRYGQYVEITTKNGCSLDVFDIIDRYYKENGALRSVLLTHSKQVADKALSIANNHPELPIDRDFVFSSAMLHDLGIILCDAPEIYCYGDEPYIRHGLCGAMMLKKDGWEEYFPKDLIDRWARVCERHTGAGLTKKEIKKEGLPLPHEDFLPESLEEKLICYADKFFSKTKIDKEKSLEKVMKGMKKYSKDCLNRFLALHEMFK